MFYIIQWMIFDFCQCHVGCRRSNKNFVSISGGSNAYPDPAPKKWVGPDPEKHIRSTPLVVGPNYQHTNISKFIHPWQSDVSRSTQRHIQHYFYAQHVNNMTFYTVSQKTRHLTLAHNFAKYWPIFKILSLLDSVENLWQIPHHTLNASLHYLVKYMCSKNRQS